ncbi:MAG TPA: hypothetical protein EYH25_01290, partial [Thermotoga sp.]|nr:hypothetical protein [Thermotoga sp.]
GGMPSVAFGSLAVAMKISSAFWFICGGIIFVLAFFFEKDVALLDMKMEKLKEEIEVFRIARSKR